MGVAMSRLPIDIRNARWVAGVDEVGRGCLAGPVFAAAVILPSDIEGWGLRDSKRLSGAQRQRCGSRIRAGAVAFALGRAEIGEIDRLNILQASLLAMRRAVAALSLRPDLCLIDGNVDPGLELPTQLVIGGDDLVPAIMAASILAKVERDAEMVRLDACHPGYGLARHKGYGTALHLAALRRLGPSTSHRMSFSPCSGMPLTAPAAFPPTPLPA